MAYKDNIEQLTQHNENFRKVLYTAKFSQLVLMCLKPGEDAGEEMHYVDQFFRFEKGQGLAVIEGKEQKVGEGDGLVVSAGTKHNIINSSKSEPLKFYTIYSPPNHRDKTVHPTKQDAATDYEHFDGRTSE